MDSALVLAAALAVFLMVFVKTEIGLYLVIFSMLLSPQFGSGGGTIAEGRRILVRSEDVLLLVVAFSWLAKTAVNKELGLAVKTPLNRPILAYVAATAIATLIGYATGTVAGVGGLFLGRIRPEVAHHILADVARRTRRHEAVGVVANPQMRVGAHPALALMRAPRGRVLEHARRPV